MSALSVEEFDQLITSARWLWRWEAQLAYHEPEEAEPFARWRTGRSDDLAWLAGWLDHIRTATNEGRRFERVRRLSDPPTDYQAWGLTIAPANIEAGEDIRVLDERQAAELDLPPYDFVIVDDQLVARMTFGPAGFAGADRLDEPDTVVRHRAWRTLAWNHATSVSTYMSRSP